MQRRSFMGVLGGLGAPGLAAQAAGADRKKTRYYLLENYYLKNGTQPARMHEYFSSALLPALNKLHSGPKIFLEALVAPHMPQVAAIYGFASLEELSAVTNGLSADGNHRKIVESWERGSEPPYESLTRTLLEATGYSPEIAAAPAGATPRGVFELRVYHSPTSYQLKALHERFAGPEIRIFRRVGVHPLFYSSTLVGPMMPNLTYLIPFQDLAAREKAWTAFGADPEWIKVRKESIDKAGQISSVISMALFKPAPYSPVK